MEIKEIHSRYILDSRGYPTTEVDVILRSGARGRASTPSGASTGSHEALELRDKGAEFGGKGVKKALFNINNLLTPKLIGKNFDSQRAFDSFILSFDTTKQKEILGANALLPLSLAFAKAVAAEKKLELFQNLRNEYAFTKDMCLPRPMINVLNGGKHAAHSTDIQEWMIVPTKQEYFAVSLEKCARVFYTLREIMSTRGVSGVGDEGGFPLLNAKSNEEALEILTQAVSAAGLTLGEDISFALDLASSEFFENNTYNLSCDDKHLTGAEFLLWQKELVSKYPIISLEDGFAEDDMMSWKHATQELGEEVQLVGDDLFVTNKERLQIGIENGIANAILIKPNQIGTLSETMDAIILAQKHGYNTIISHRSGETEDTSIAHIAVATGAGQIKTGSLSRTERLVKYNELLRISEMLQ